MMVHIECRKSYTRNTSIESELKQANTLSSSRTLLPTLTKYKVSTTILEVICSQINNIDSYPPYNDFVEMFLNVFNVVLKAPIIFLVRIIL